MLSADELAAYKKGLPPTREEREKRAADIQKLLAEAFAAAEQADVTQYLDWEVLPPGEAGVERILGGGGEWVTGRPDPRRLKFLLSLRPWQCYRGSSLGQRVYIVAVFPKVAVADTGEYGNALYYYRCSDDEWMRVFRKKTSKKREGLERNASFTRGSGKSECEGWWGSEGQAPHARRTRSGASRGWSRKASALVLKTNSMQLPGGIAPRRKPTCHVPGERNARSAEQTGYGQAPHGTPESPRCACRANLIVPLRQDPAACSEAGHRGSL